MRVKTSPDKPTIKLSLNDYNSISITINPSKGASRYIVEYSIDDVIYESINENALAGTYIKENLEVGQKYYFRVRACNSDNKCSGWSKSSIKQTPKSPSVTVSAASKMAVVTIGQVNGADGYEIYRSTTKNGKYILVKSLLESDGIYTFEEKTTVDKYYYYKARSYRQENDGKVYSPYSYIKSIKGIK